MAICASCAGGGKVAVTLAHLLDVGGVETGSSGTPLSNRNPAWKECQFNNCSLVACDFGLSRAAHRPCHKVIPLCQVCKIARANNFTRTSSGAVP
eukprot:2503808-Amphidinium_carterae.1